MTSADRIRYGTISTDTGVTYGGYSGRFTVNEKFAIKIPKGYPLESAGPLFCSGITMYTPLKDFGCSGGGKRVGIVGVGGLGQMGIRMASAMGNKVTAISRSLSKSADSPFALSVRVTQGVRGFFPEKKDEALSMGATDYLVSADEEAMAAATRSLDLIIDTAAAPHQATTYMKLLDKKGTIVMLGVFTEPQHKVQHIKLRNVLMYWY